MLAAVGGNDPDAVTQALGEMSARWTEAARDRAIQQMTTIAAGNVFDGGNVYRLTKLENDLEEHLVTLRLRTGEVAGMLLRYQWTNDGLALVAVEAKRQIIDLLGPRAIGAPERVPCS